MSFSKTALKEIARQSKNQLLEMVVKISNYAENQKAQNIILLKYVEELKTQLKKESILKSELNKEPSAEVKND
jgi:hypothetical protein